MRTQIGDEPCQPSALHTEAINNELCGQWQTAAMHSVADSRQQLWQDSQAACASLQGVPRQHIEGSACPPRGEPAPPAFVDCSWWGSLECCPWNTCTSLRHIRRWTSCIWSSRTFPHSQTCNEVVCLSKTVQARACAAAEFAVANCRRRCLQFSRGTSTEITQGRWKQYYTMKKTTNTMKTLKIAISLGRNLTALLYIYLPLV